MPIYAYRCAACGHAKDVLQKISDPLLTPARPAAPQPSQAGHRGRLPAQGLGLVRHRLQAAARRAEPQRPRTAPPSRGQAPPSPPARPTPPGRTRLRSRRPHAARGSPAAAASRPRAATLSRARAHPKPAVKKYLIAGLLVWLPLAITIWVLTWLLGVLDGVFGWLLSRHAGGAAQRPRAPLESLRHVPGPGRGRAGRWCCCSPACSPPTSSASGGCGSGTAAAAPHPDRQVDLQLGQAGLRHAVLQQRQCLPRGGAGAVPARRAPGPSPSSPASPAARWRTHLPGDYVSVYVPTTPNPTSGFFLMMPRADVHRAAR